MRNHGFISWLVCLLLSGTAAAAAYDFDYRIAGDAEVRPAQVFDDGAKTYFQFTPGQPVPVILSLGPAGERMAEWRVEGPYTVVQGLNTDWRMRLGRSLAAARHAGVRPPAAGVLYGAAKPLAETGVAALPDSVVATPVSAKAPKPESSMPAPADPLPEFTGAFVVHESSEGTAVAPAAHSSQEGMKELRMTLKISLRAPAVTIKAARAVGRSDLRVLPRVLPMEPLPIRFAGNGLSPHAGDMAAVAERIRAAPGVVEIYAYSGARSQAERGRWALQRGARIKMALVRSGVDPGQIRVVASKVASVPLALVGFAEGVRV